MSKKRPPTIIERLEALHGLCAPGCEGRCRDCPQDVVNAAIVALQSQGSGTDTRIRATREMVDAAFNKWLELSPTEALPESFSQADIIERRIEEAINAALACGRKTDD